MRTARNDTTKRVGKHRLWSPARWELLMLAFVGAVFLAGKCATWLANAIQRVLSKWLKQSRTSMQTHPRRLFCSFVSTGGTARRSRKPMASRIESLPLHGSSSPAPRCLWRLRRPAEEVARMDTSTAYRVNAELWRDGTRHDPRRHLARCASEFRLQAVQCAAVAAAGILPLPARRARNTRWTNTTVETLAVVPIQVNRQWTRIHANAVVACRKNSGGFSIHSRPWAFIRGSRPERLFTVNALNQLTSIPDSTPAYDRRE